MSAQQLLADSTMNKSSIFRPWLESELAALRDGYLSTRSVDLNAIAATVGRSRAAVACKANDLGLTSVKGSQAPAPPAPPAKAAHGNCKPLVEVECAQCGGRFSLRPSAAAIRKFCSQRCAYNNKDRIAHIKKKDRGSALCEVCHKRFDLTKDTRTGRFCSHRCAMKVVHALSLVARKLNPPIAKARIIKKCGNCQKEFTSWASSRRVYCCQKCSVWPSVAKTIATRKAALKSGVSARMYSRAKAQWMKLGSKRFYARSRWEANYARYLEWQKTSGLIVEWEHEPETFWFEKIRRGVRSYLPDFRVTMADGSVEYHEVKGWMDRKSLTKTKRMAKYHPAVVLKIFGEPWFKANSSQLSALVPGWEKDSSRNHLKRNTRRSR